MSYHLVQGDATKPQGDPDAIKLITHVCNDEGKWGAGFVLALRRAYPTSEKAYRDKGSYALGEVQFVDCGADCNNDIWVANMIAQHGTKWLKDGTAKGCPPLRYDALWEAMLKVQTWATSQIKPVEIHAPKFGSDLAGGKWDIIQSFIYSIWAGHSNTYIYEYVPPTGPIQDNVNNANNAKRANVAKQAKNDSLEDLFG